MQRKEKENVDKLYKSMSGCQLYHHNSAPAYQTLEKIDSTRPGKIYRQRNVSSRGQGGGYSGYACRILQLQRKVAQQVSIQSFLAELGHITNDEGASYCQTNVHAIKYFQELSMMQMKSRHDQNLADISSQLFKLQANLMTKERYLGQLIKEREQVGLFILKGSLQGF